MEDNQIIADPFDIPSTVPKYVVQLKHHLLSDEKR